MKYTKDERISIGRQVYTHELSEAEAQLKYGVGRTCIQNYMRQYKEANGISIKRRKKADSPSIRYLPDPDMAAYQAMTKEELINELIRAKVNEARAKKGYAVKGVGATKEYISLNNKNSKS